MDWKHLLAYITGSVDQELLVRNEYLITENRILRQQITGRVRLSDGERKTLAKLGKRLGRQALKAFIRAHMDMRVATDFFTTEIWTACGVVTNYVWFLIHLASRKA
jgi:hypothetical protein